MDERQYKFAQTVCMCSEGGEINEINSGGQPYPIFASNASLPEGFRWIIFTLLFSHSSLQTKEDALNHIEESCHL